MLTKVGTKLLDFGLAKLRDPKTAGLSGSQRPTESAGLTGEGKILGTLQYMAPEQLEGAEADSRTDIFAFGAVVHEMATGKKAFEGKSPRELRRRAIPRLHTECARPTRPVRETLQTGGWKAATEREAQSADGR